MAKGRGRFGFQCTNATTMMGRPEIEQFHNVRTARGALGSEMDKNGDQAM